MSVGVEKKEESANKSNVAEEEELCQSVQQIGNSSLTTCIRRRPKIRCYQIIMQSC